MRFQETTDVPSRFRSRLYKERFFILLLFIFELLIMAATLVGGAALGAVFGELLKAVLETKDKAIMFKPTLASLQSTLVSIAPVVKEIEQHNNDLDRPKGELESLIRKMHEGIELVYKCSKITKRHFLKRFLYREKLVAVEKSIEKFFNIDLQAQNARDQKETLLYVKRILTALSNPPLAITMTSSSDSAEQLVIPFAGTMQETGQSEAYARNNGQVHPSKLVFLDSSYSFDLEDLLRASNETLGERSYGTTYKYTLEDGSATVVVKWLTEVKVSEAEFEQQVEILQTLLPEHPNVCYLRAYYYSNDEILLISDYIARDSFSALMHERSKIGWTQLDWRSRMKISLGAARGIAHIHSISDMNFVHGNIKSSNVLVKADFQGCISDFGITRLLGLSVIPSENKGYQAPEVIETGKLTQKSDVYSFGILLLEMLMGKSLEEDPNLRSWFDLQGVDGLLYELFDDAIKDDIGVWDMMSVAMACASMVPDKRPSMAQVVWEMEGLMTSNYCN